MAGRETKSGTEKGRMETRRKRKIIQGNGGLRKREDELWACRARGMEEGAKERGMNIKH